MSDKLNNDSELCAKLIPDWELGCRRVTPGEGYLESFLLPYVHLNQNSITHITENAVHTSDGQSLEVDISQYFFICNQGDRSANSMEQLFAQPALTSLTVRITLSSAATKSTSSKNGLTNRSPIYLSPALIFQTILSLPALMLLWGMAH